MERGGISGLEVTTGEGLKTEREREREIEGE